MTTIKIFEDNTEIDLEKLIETRLLFLANAGGGKSYAFRKLLEEINNRIMVIILDVEGEYHTLREKFDYLLIGGKDGDIPLSLKSATPLPKKLFEHNISTIIDISELKGSERIQYVKKFLEALMELPRKYWKPCIIGVEETHKLCGQQDRHDSGPAVIDLFTRGRKRGYCGVAITQRIAKLHKDVVAECNNVFAGRMWLPNDIKTTSQILGMSIKEAMELLRNLNPGELYCFGPAINKNIHRGMIGKVKTTHIKMGIDLKEQISSPTDKIKKILSKLSDLPKKADEELKEKADYLRKIHELEKRLRIASRTKVNEGNTKELISRLAPAERNYKIQKQKADSFEKQSILWRSHYEDLKANFDRSNKNLVLIGKREKVYSQGHSILKEMSPMIQQLIAVEKNIKNFYRNWERTNHFIKLIKIDELPYIKNFEKLPEPTVNPGKGKIIQFGTEPSHEDIKKIENKIDAKIGLPPEIEEVPLSKCAKIVYGFLLSNPGREFTRTQLGLITGYSYNSGGFQTAIAALNTKEMILKQGDKISLNSDNINDEIKPQGEYTLNLIKKRLGKCAEEILDVVLENPSMEYTREELAMATITQYSYNSGGFQTAVAKLNVLGLIKKEGSIIKLNEEINELIER